MLFEQYPETLFDVTILCDYVTFGVNESWRLVALSGN